ncbi:hypothetical protein Scep_010625 [Stephania cephalantha]|uniref:X8 domain-containing protein n=1 Tax=Stephania cephalantha TaxID=152367 RepID=A0AAP0JW68_9MAGN
MERLATSWEPPTAMVLVVAVAVICCGGVVMVEGATATWCVARSNVKWEALQTALDYACGSGADCAPIQPNGLCSLPNTMMSHSSYAFNSFYQRKSKAPGSCDFAGAAYIAMTDPSYGSCVYPSSPRLVSLICH